MSHPQTTPLPIASEPSCGSPCCALARARPRRWLATFAIFLLALGLLRLALVDGWWRPIEIVGPSMAPTLWGPSVTFTCNACGRPQRMVVTDKARSIPKEWVCGNCGYRQAFSGLNPEPGDRVYIDRAAYLWRSPRRHDLVAIESSPGDWKVKRIAGLPGEAVSIQGGDLWIDGQRSCKTLHQLRQCLTIVHDDRYRPQGSAPRWAPMTAGDWSESPDHAYRLANLRDGGPLRYEHRSHDRPQRDWGPARIYDDDIQNPHTRRVLNPCEDLSVSGKVKLSDGMRAVTQVRLAVTFWTSDGPRTANLELNVGPEALAWQAAWFDGRLWVQDGQGDRPVETSNENAMVVDPEHPVAITLTTRFPAELDQLAVYRDQWITSPLGSGVDQRDVFLGEDEYFVLGDNSPISIDSRQDPHGVTAKQILGRVGIWPGG